MRYTLGLIASLAAFWLLLSGLYTPLLLGFGLASVIGVAWLARRMDIIDHESAASAYSPRLFLYWAWLLPQILRSTLRVSWLILTRPGSVAPVMRATPNTANHDLNQVTYANSITLTPGTLAVRVLDDRIEVHGLQAGSIDELDAGAMRDRVSALHTR